MIYRLLPADSLTNQTKAGKALLSYGLKLEANINYWREPLIYNAWGKPSLKNYPELHYNISHCDQHIACVICQDIVGIDVEKIRSFNVYAARRAYSSAELQRVYAASEPNREFFRYWTLKESYLKAIGQGLSWPMKSVNFVIKPSGEILSNVANARFIILEDVDGFVTAVCYLKYSGEEVKHG